MHATQSSFLAQEKHGFGLHYSTDQFKTQLNALDFRGNSVLLAGGKNGEVSLLLSYCALNPGSPVVTH